ncbi:hypothetical protein ACFWV1_13035 [Streptomyces sp. NPDC058700]|uniref:hypothetical protein n=1 Tax=Streptomyces sp. NPDC058700 TaxID=3346607 RepID=UPI00365C5502
MSNYEPTSARNRRGRPQMAEEVQQLADELARRAAQIHARSEGELSIPEAVALAAFRMGVEAPQTVTEPGDEP